MSRIARKQRARKHPRIVLGTPDGGITPPRAGLQLVAKLDALLSITRTIDQVAPSVKQRRRGLRLGEFVVAVAETTLSGGDFFVDLDHQREDAAGLALRAVPEVPAWTTVIGIGKRFAENAPRGVERANAVLAARAFVHLPKKRKANLSLQCPTIDLDPTTVEVYGHSKKGSAFNNQGQLAYRPHPAIWAEAG